MLSIALLGACTTTLVADGGHVAVQAPELAPPDGPAPYEVLVGSRTCPTLACAGGGCPDPSPSADAMAACYDASIDHGAWDGACMTFDTVGTASWSFAPGIGCDWAAPDVLSLDVVGPDSVTGGFESVLEAAVEDAIAGGTVACEHPADWKLSGTEPFRFVAGGGGVAYPVLRGADGRRVAWSPSTLPYVAIGGSEAVLPDTAASIALPLPVDEADVVVRAADGDIAVGHVQTVPGTAAASLEIVVAYGLADDGTSTPAAARAIVRDADGSLLFGAPVSWASDDLAWSGDVFDYVGFDGTCTPPSAEVGEQHATLTATFGDLTDTIDVVWTPRTTPGDDSAWTPPPACSDGPDTDEELPSPGGCGGCTSAGGPGSALLIGLALAALAARRRT
jgi:uncharacterized protein (TIGR03382 family)